jgi:cellobiose-specific phosphotransferase system component IIA
LFFEIIANGGDSRKRLIKALAVPQVKVDHEKTSRALAHVVNASRPWEASHLGAVLRRRPTDWEMM